MTTRSATAAAIADDPLASTGWDGQVLLNPFGPRRQSTDSPDNKEEA